MADNFGADLDQLPRSVINGQCSTSSGSINFSFWLIREVPATSAPRPVYPQQETFGIDIRLCKPRWHETFACREAGIVNSLFRAENSLFGLKNSLLCCLGNLAKKLEIPVA